MTKIHFEVRVYCYHYNSGRGDNGYETEIIKYDDEQSARKTYLLAEICAGQLTSGSAEFVDRYFGYTCGGFVESVEGIFKVETTETKL